MFSVVLALATILVAFATAGVPAAAAAKVVTATQCELALQVIRDVTSHHYGRPLVFETATSDVFVGQIDADALAKGWTKYVDGNSVDIASLPRQLAAEFLDRGLRTNSVSSCPSVRNWLTHHRIKYGIAAVHAVTARSIDDELPAGIFTVSLPVVSDDGQLALVYTSDVWGGLAGGGAIQLYRRQADGTWKFITDRRLWVS